MKDLEACPFCDTPATYKYNIIQLDTRPWCWCVFCKHCGCEGPTGMSAAEAVELWNNRKG